MKTSRGGPAAGADGEGRVRCRMLLAGRVQGVGFRYFAIREAQALGVGGFVRNLPDGRLEAEAEGSPAAVEVFLERLRRGPAGAAVRRVEASWQAARGEEVFRVA